MYEQFHIKGLLRDEQALRDDVDDDEMIISYFQHVYQESRVGKKPRDMETLAFHIITMPEITELKNLSENCFLCLLCEAKPRITNTKAILFG